MATVSEPFWTDLGLKKKKKVELVCGVYLHLKKKKRKGRWGMNLQNLPSKSSHARKKPPPVHEYHNLVESRGFALKARVK